MRGQTATIHLSSSKGYPMDFYSFAPVAAALNAAYSVVNGLSGLLAPLAAGSAAVVAIVLVTLVLRSALIPVGMSQMRAQAARTRLAPRLQELQRRYKKNRELLLRKTQELYASEKVSPFAGMLPTLIQAPVISLVYGLFVRPEIGGHANALLAQHLFGVPLGTSLGSLLATGAAWPGILVFVTLLVIIALVAAASRRVALATPPAPGATAAARRLTRIMSWLPFITVVFAGLVPLAATLYLAVTTSWTLAERAILRRRYLMLPSGGIALPNNG
jgi:YidC/Oxa1 family membrane protein insertase